MKKLNLSDYEWNLLNECIDLMCCSTSDKIETISQDNEFFKDAKAIKTEKAYNKMQKRELKALDKISYKIAKYRGEI
jgi:hypothetical protein